MPETFFTSDTHFYHKRIIELMPTRRALWLTVEDMNEGLIERWNSFVGPADTVYHVGDFILGDSDDDILISILGRLHGRIKLIPGNHDTAAKLAAYERLGSPEILPPLTYLKKLGGQIPATLCHFPLASWVGNSRGSWMLHGHCHGNYKGEGRIMDVGVDTHPEFRPYHVDEIYECMKDLPISTDRHERTREQE